MTDTPDSPATRAGEDRSKSDIVTLASPADTLRAAAARIREKRDGTTAAPWSTHHDWPGRVFSTEHHVARTTGYRADTNAAWISLMHPGVGELIADWLETTAEYYAPGATHPTHVVRALAVARAVLEAGQ